MDNICYNRIQRVKCGWIYRWISLFYAIMAVTASPSERVTLEDEVLGEVRSWENGK